MKMVVVKIVPYSEQQNPIVHYNGRCKIETKFKKKM